MDESIFGMVIAGILVAVIVVIIFFMDIAKVSVNDRPVTTYLPAMPNVTVNVSVDYCGACARQCGWNISRGVKHE